MTNRTARLVVVLLSTVILVALFAGTASATPFHSPLTLKELVGKYLFFDKHLSEPYGQACAACHDPSVGFTGPDARINAAGAVYEGAVPGRFGNRKPPAAAYAGASPILYMMSPGAFKGGMFWDGRATGWTLGDPLAEQAQGPFLNPLEQNNPSAAAVVAKVKVSEYGGLFKKVWGPEIFRPTNVTYAYECIARSIAAYERSSEVSKFTSRYDAYLKTGTGLTAQERAGLQLFKGKGKCANCHVAPLFTDFTYDNLGMPKNPLNPFYNMPPIYNPLGADWVDMGLGGFLVTTAGKAPDFAAYAEENYGKQKVPTLRNVDKRPYNGFVKAYGHNGYFKSLGEIVHFYNTRDVPGAGWPDPEYPNNINKVEMGNLGLTIVEEKAIVAFLQTLTDQ